MQEYIKKYDNNNKSHGNNITLIISNDEIEDIIKIIKSLEDSSLLLKGVTETIQNGQGIYKAGKGKGVLRAGEGVLRAGYGRPSSSASQNKIDF